MNPLLPILRFGAVVTAVTGFLLAAGLLMTRSSPTGTWEAIVWACAVVFVGSMVGMIPLVLGAPAPEGRTGAGTTPGLAPGVGPAAVSRFLASMLVRMGSVAVGSVAVVLLGEVAVKPFLLWLAVSYLALLIVETAFALRVFRRL